MPAKALGQVVAEIATLATNKGVAVPTIEGSSNSCSEPVAPEMPIVIGT